LVLDQINRRVVSLGVAGEVEDSRPCPPGPDDLTVGPDGRLYVLSSVNQRITVLAPAEEEPAEVHPLPRPLRLLAGLAWGSAGQLLLVHGHQGTYDLGGPGRWTPWPDLLHTQRDGVPGRWGGPRVQLMLSDGRGVLLRRAAPGAAPVSVPLAATSGVASLGFVDSRLDGDTVVLVERLLANGVRRELVRFQPDGAVHSRTSVPSRPLYRPFRELQAAPDGSVYQLHPRPDGMRLLRHQLGGGS